MTDDTTREPEGVEPEQPDAETVTPDAETVVPETADAVEESPTEVEQAAADGPQPAAEPARPGLARTVTVISLRVVRGLAGVAVALVVIAAVGLVSAPTLGVTPLAVTVAPEPADLLRTCVGSLQRLGDDTGADAGTPSAVGSPEVTVAARAGGVTTGGDAFATLTMAPSEGALLAASQSQQAEGEGGLRGLAASGCGEPSGSTWLVGGSMSVGRTTLLVLANPTAVDAEVTLRMWGEEGEVVARGMSGITVAPGAQRVIPLSGYAPGLASPVVHVSSRGGQVVAALQTSVIRVLDAGGVDVVGAGLAPSREFVIPGVRIFDVQGVASSLGLDDHADLDGIVRLANPGDEPAQLEVEIVSAADDGAATSFPYTLPAGTVADVPLASALELGAGPLPDGDYTVTISSDEPVVAGVRTSTIPAPTTDRDGTPVPGPADLAWFSSADALAGDVAVAVADGPGAVLVVENAENTSRTLVIEPLDGGDPIEVELRAAGSTAIPLDGDGGYLLRDVDGLRAAVSFAGTGLLAGYPVTVPLAADAPIVVRP